MVYSDEKQISDMQRELSKLTHQGLHGRLAQFYQMLPSSKTVFWTSLQVLMAFSGGAAGVQDSALSEFLEKDVKDLPELSDMYNSLNNWFRVHLSRYVDQTMSLEKLLESTENKSALIYTCASWLQSASYVGQSLLTPTSMGAAAALFPALNGIILGLNLAPTLASVGKLLYPVLYTILNSKNIKKDLIKQLPQCEAFLNWIFSLNILIIIAGVGVLGAAGAAIVTSCPFLIPMFLQFANPLKALLLQLKTTCIEILSSLKSGKPFSEELKLWIHPSSMVSLRFFLEYLSVFLGYYNLNASILSEVNRVAEYVNILMSASGLNVTMQGKIEILKTSPQDSLNIKSALESP